ncbi:hypothetical protein [Pseudodesulfovibrio sp.]|uniref:hypothetical protein n=1 Tax=Pseudodesulfovibrio sp. TaxID=2035812 RepID=UPI0026060779|nr:hypothetical protein [Pseudodesulfovibrio sp.]MDD3313781.1 hypothetical protein [Pseudodesulfovibrio sp.]
MATLGIRTDYRLLKAEKRKTGEVFEFTHDDQGRRAVKYRNGQPVEAYRWLDFLRLNGFHDGESGYRFAYGEGERTPYAMQREDGAARPIAAAPIDMEDLGLFLKTEIGLNEIYKKYYSRQDGECGRACRSSFYECYIEDNWPRIEQSLLKTKDSSLLKIFLDFIVSEENSADEEPSFILGKIYFHRASGIEALLEWHSDADKQWVIDSIVWGLKNLAGKDDPNWAKTVELQQRILRFSPQPFIGKP